MPNYRMHLMICTGTGCVSNKAFKVKEVLEQELVKQSLKDEVQVVPTGCHGFCAQGPIVLVQPEGIFYQKLQVE
ncbi:MAG: (2Fe-2S) ferredoxin domain-containing protein, partial [Spirochaetota bacterium]